MSECLSLGQNLFEQPPIQGIIEDEGLFPVSFLKENGRLLFVAEAIRGQSPSKNAVSPEHRSSATIVQDKLLVRIEKHSDLLRYLREMLEASYRTRDGRRVKSVKIKDRTYYAWLERRVDGGYGQTNKNLRLQGMPDIDYSSSEDVINALLGKGRVNRHRRFVRSQDD